MLHYPRPSNPPPFESPIIPVIGAQFLHAPDVSKQAAVRAAFKGYSLWTDALFSLIEIPVEFVADDPYPDSDTMRERVLAERVMLISTIGNDHPLLSPESNLKGRAVHDFMAHIVCGCPFDGRGEFNAFEAQAALYPIKYRWALFSEIVGQACYFLTFGNFFEGQKIVKFPRPMERQARVLRQTYPHGIGLARAVSEGFFNEKIFEIAQATGYSLRYQYAVLEKQTKTVPDPSSTTPKRAANPSEAPKWARWLT